MIREPLATQNPDHSREFFLAINRECRNAANHAMGIFCLDCRGIPMPWGQNLPQVHDDRGNRVLRGSPGTVLAGVRLNSLRAIATLSTVAYLEVTRQPHATVDGLANMETQYAASADAGRRIARLWRTLRNVAQGEGRSVPHYYDLILRALMEPFLSEDALGNSFLGHQADGGSSSRRSGEGSAHPGSGDQVLGSREGRGAIEPSPTPPTQGQDLGGPSGEEGSEEESGEDDSMDDDDDEDEDEKDLGDSDSIMPSREKKSGFQFNRPAKRRPWEFVPGSDLSPAELGKPDPSKFFLIRQNKNNHFEKDIRQYPRWEKFDWNNKGHIDCLNRHRRQIKSRTRGATHEPRLPWTQMEHDVLKDLVDQAIQSGKHRLSIDWDEISATCQSASRTLFRILAKQWRKLPNSSMAKSCRQRARPIHSSQSAREVSIARAPRSRTKSRSLVTSTRCSSTPSPWPIKVQRRRDQPRNSRISKTPTTMTLLLPLTRRCVRSESSVLTTVRRTCQTEDRSHLDLLLLLVELVVLLGRWVMLVGLL
jgi:hypothetical protein